jgi:YegS/Rv2252/BmrU family lipid kinase
MESPPNRAVLLVNDKSRRGKEWFDRAEVGLRAAGVELVTARKFRTISELIRIADSSIKSGVPMVVAGGGDGTFSAIIHLFVDKPTVLGVLPLGTGNAFARDLQIPFNVDGAVKILTGGQVLPVDIATIEDDYFVNVATVGLTTKIADALTNDAKRKYGRMVYLFALARALGQASAFRARLTLDGAEHEFETLQIVIGNGRYHAGPFRLSPEAGIRDRRLTMYALQTTSKSAFIKLAVRMASGTQRNLGEVFGAEFREGRLETSPIKRVTIDGEVGLRTPIHFSCRPAAVRVVVATTTDLD